MLLDGVLTSTVQEEIGRKLSEAEGTNDKRITHPTPAQSNPDKRLLVLGIHFLIYVVMLVPTELAYVCFSCSAFSVLFVTKLGS